MNIAVAVVMKARFQYEWDLQLGNGAPQTQKKAWRDSPNRNYEIMTTKKFSLKAYIKIMRVSVHVRKIILKTAAGHTTKINPFFCGTG